MIEIECGKIIDPATEAVRSDVSLFIDGEEIIGIGDENSDAADQPTSVVDHSDQVIIPGLIDAHVHLGGWRSLEWFDWLVADPARGAATATADLRSLLKAGFTTVREMGSTTGLGLRTAVEQAHIPGPRIFASGLGLSQSGGFSDPEYLPQHWAKERGNGISQIVDGPAECRSAVRDRIRQNADHIKIWTTGTTNPTVRGFEGHEFSEEELAVIVEEAHSFGIPVASHSSTPAGISAAIASGVDTIEHGTILDDHCIRQMNDNDVILVPTLAYSYRFMTRGDEFGVDSDQIVAAEETFDQATRTVQQASESDITIAHGTDFTGPDLLPHGENMVEMELYSDQVGMDEMAILKTATCNAARAIGNDHIGRLHPGNYADLVVLDSDPLSDIQNVRDVHTVYLGGKGVEA